MDTITLITSASRHCLELLRILDDQLASRVRSSLRRSDYDGPAKPQINWSSQAERHELVNEIFSDATAIIAACSSLGNPIFDEAVALLRVVAAQDLEEDEDGGVKIKQGVAKDRVISTVDVDARHGHRSRRVL
jgi:hypothetical protein